MDQRLLRELQRVARRYRRWYLWTALAVGWFVAALVGAGLLVLGWATGWALSWTAPVLALLGLAAACVGIALAVRSSRDHAAMARRIEEKHRELESLLLAAIQQRPSHPDGRFGFLQESIIGDALAHNRRNDWREAIPRQRIRAVQLAGIVSLALLVLVTTRLASHAGSRSSDLVALAVGDAELHKMPYSVIVTPGDAEIERGTSLVVTARFDRRVPDDATLVCRDESQATVRLPMSLSLSDPMFGGRVADVRSDLSYRVEYAGQATREYRIAVYEHPRLERADARLVFPKYTSLEEKRVEDTRRITAVEGTEVTLFCHLNKPVESACLVDENGEQIDLAAQPESPTVYSVARVPRESGRYRLHLVDAAGRKNKQPPEIVLQITPNRPSDVKISRPARDMRVSPIEELLTEASLWDDFGLTSYGVSLSLGGDPPKEVVLGGQAGRNERREIEHTIEFEMLKAEADQLLSYFFWAEDIGPDGQPRRTFGDMYFAEVRPFEEIFRQGEQPPSGDGQQEQQGEGENAQQAEELAQKQKQIINATWNVVRRETQATPSDAFAEDATQLQTAQQEALEQLATLAEKIEDPESQQHVADVRKQMDDALAHLAQSVQSLDPKTLHPALAAERAAYQALLKLRAREHRVVRGNPQQQQQQSGSASGAQSRAQQQLEQLELENEENRYETQRQAQSQQDQASRENRQVLNRLRDLARRQNDLNERLKELQSALEEAKTDQEREEIERRLKRLREQQQEIMRDVDELRDRMAQPENQERMADSRQDLQQTRENIRQTTEALEQGQVSRAVASGTRAERELKQMREEFRRQASSRFSEEMKELRQEARELDQNEDELAERLRDLEEEKSKTGRLREPDGREQIGEGFQRQREDLDSLLDDIRETIEAAEETEPLMSGQLYDTLRRTRQRRVEDALDVTRSMLERGIIDQARAAESQAGQGIEELKQSVEQAAESVLGDEDEALRRAHEVLKDLADQLNQEVEQSNSREPSGNRAGEPNPQRENGNRQTEPPDEEPDRPQAEGQGGQPAQQPRQSQTNQGRPSLRGDQPNEPRGRNSDGRQSPDASEQEPQEPAGPIAGNDFLRWSDQLRDVEEMMEAPELRAEAARIRDRARAVRRQARGGSTGPNWDIVREFVSQPLCELRDRVAEELLRRGAKETMVPIDRDPVPPKYTEQVRRYYEQLGSGK